jgi:predicted ATPase
VQGHRQPGAPIRHISVDRGKVVDGWPFTLPVVQQLVANGIDLAPGITVLMGDNGSGKSTLVEAIASAWARRIVAFRNDIAQQVLAQPSAEDSPLDRALHLQFTTGGPTGGLFLRAERLHEQTRLLDEPESALSFTGSLALLQILGEMAANGSQVLLATHSPILASAPGAALFELDDAGMTATTYDECLLVSSWRSFLAAPERYLRHLG